MQMNHNSTASKDKQRENHTGTQSTEGLSKQTKGLANPTKQKHSPLRGSANKSFWANQTVQESSPQMGSTSKQAKSNANNKHKFLR
eukprot:5442467-Amphidinium_carterae.1